MATLKAVSVEASPAIADQFSEAVPERPTTPLVYPNANDTTWEDVASYADLHSQPHPPSGGSFLLCGMGGSVDHSTRCVYENDLVTPRCGGSDGSFGQAIASGPNWPGTATSQVFQCHYGLGCDDANNLDAEAGFSARWSGGLPWTAGDRIRWYMYARGLAGSPVDAGLGPWDTLADQLVETTQAVKGFRIIGSGFQQFFGFGDGPGSVITSWYFSHNTIGGNVEVDCLQDFPGASRRPFSPVDVLNGDWWEWIWEILPSSTFNPTTTTDGRVKMWLVRLNQSTGARVPGRSSNPQPTMDGRSV